MEAETERLERIARGHATMRQKNREAGIPDMDYGDRHEPAEYFGQVGFFAVLDYIGGPSQPVNDWSEEGGTEEDREAYLEARRLDHRRVAGWLRSAEIKDYPNRHGVIFGGIRIKWPDRIPALKVWAGQQTLAQIIRQRQKALPDEIGDIIAAEAPISGSSGLYGPCATTTLEDGFSVDGAGMGRVTPVGLELLAIIGLEQVPITVYPDGAIGYETDGDGYEFRGMDQSRWRFRIEQRNQYYYRWGTSQRS